ncbi:MAG: hypothetical protein IKD76_02530 [Clostridia bacterium]|nr:hypothetical protein [Clostridia bacterium]
MENNIENKKKSKKLIVIIIIVAITLIAVLATTGIFVVKEYFLDSGSSDSSSKKEKTEVVSTKGTTKTLMIYMCGSDLESKGGIATSNLQDLISSKIDYDNMNIVLCAGGSSKWYNTDISKTETSYFKVTSDGLELIKRQSKSDMASSTTLTNFVDYAYENYKTDDYYLMFWDHGCALAGLEFDELSNKLMTLKDLNTALKNTKINKANKKFGLIVLNNCLMGNLEVANIMSNYGEYLVASEDVMYGGKGLTTFEFLEGIKKSDDAVKVGKNYIDTYTKTMKKNNPGTYITFSLIDLSKIENVVTELDKFFGEIKLDETSFKKIAQIRSGVYEYQKAEDCYDMVDLYQLITKLKPVNSESKKLLSAIEDAVVYKSVTDPYSNGISVYFPETYDWTKVYETIDYSDAYEKFAKDYIAIGSGKKKTSMAMNMEVTKTNTGFSVQLTDEQKEDYKSAKFILFEDNGDGTYNTVLSSGDTKIDENGRVTANVDNKLLAVVDKSDGTKFPMGYIIEVDRTDEYVMYDVGAIMVEPYGEDYITPMTPVLINIKVYNDGKVERLATRRCDSDSGIEGKKTTNGEIIDIKDSEKYKSIYFIKSARKIDVDENGNYKELGELSSSEGVSIDINSEFTFEKIDLDSSKKYVGVFVVTDVYDNTYSSKLIDVK